MVILCINFMFCVLVWVLHTTPVLTGDKKEQGERERRSEERERETLSVNVFDTPVDVGNACLWFDSFAVLSKS